MLRVGTKIEGYCGGTFELGPDELRVEAIGADWVIVRAIDSFSWAYPQLYVGAPEKLLEWIVE